MRDLLIFLVFFCAAITTFIRPHIGILVWSWISYMNPHRLVWGAASSIRFAFIIAVVTLIAWILSREPKSLPKGAVPFLIIMLMMWFSVTTYFAALPEASEVAWVRNMKMLLMSLATLVLMQSRERIHALLWVVVVSIGFFGVKGGVWFMTSTGSGLVWGPDDSFIADNTSFGLALVMIIPLLFYLQTISAILWVRLGLAMVGLLCIVSVVATFSRGAFLAVGAMVLMFVMRSRRRFLIGALAIAVVMAVGFYAPETWVERMQTIENFQQDSSAMARIHTWQFAINLALDRPVLGGGFKAFDDPNLWSRFAPEGALARAYHSIYFQMLGDHGFVGLGIFLALGLAGWAAARRVIRLTRDRPDFRWANQLARMLQVSMAGFAVGGAFLSLAGFDLYYLLLVIAFLLQVVVERELDFRESQPAVLAVGAVDPSVGRRAPLGRDYRAGMIVPENRDPDR